VLKASDRARLRIRAYIVVSLLTSRRTGQGTVIAAYLRWRNARAQPKRGFAPGSVIRTWTSYQNKVA
jgi:hypothetical protein